MIDESGRATSKPRTWTQLTALLAVFALSFLTIRLLAGSSAGGYPAPPFFHLFFSDTIHMKAWLATGAITLALFQALSAVRLFALFHWAPSGRFWGRMHRSIPGQSNPGALRRVRRMGAARCGGSVVRDLGWTLVDVIALFLQQQSHHSIARRQTCSLWVP